MTADAPRRSHADRFAWELVGYCYTVWIDSYRVDTMDEAQVREQRIQSLRELAAEITELAGHLNAAHYRWLSLIAEFDRRQGWSDGATQSCAHWLNCYLPFRTMSDDERALRVQSKNSAVDWCGARKITRRSPVRG